MQTELPAVMVIILKFEVRIETSNMQASIVSAKHRVVPRDEV